MSAKTGWDYWDKLTPLERAEAAGRYGVQLERERAEIRAQLPAPKPILFLAERLLFTVVPAGVSTVRAFHWLPWRKVKATSCTEALEIARDIAGSQDVRIVGVACHPYL